MATWRSLARELQLTLLVPAAARAEANLARPDDSDLIDVLLCGPLHRWPGAEVSPTDSDSVDIL